MPRHLLVIAVPFVALATFVAYFGVELPFWDEWYFVPELDAHARGETSWLESAWMPHCEHRMLVPKAVFAKLWPALAWNVPLLLVLHVAFVALLTFWLASRLSHSLASSALIACVILNPHAWENWIWGWQFQSHACVALGCVGIYLTVYRPFRGASALAITILVLSGLSFVCGFAFGAAACIAWIGQRRWRIAGLALLVFVAAGILHLTTLPDNAFQASSFDPTKQLGAAGLLVLDYLATPLVGRKSPEALAWTVAAIALLAILAAGLRLLTKRPEQHDQSSMARTFAQALCVAALGSGLLIALGRAELEGSGRSSRYVSFACLAWVGFAGLGTWPQRRAPRSSEEDPVSNLPQGRALANTLAITAVAMLCLTSPSSIASALGRTDATNKARSALLSGEGLSHETLACVFNDHRSIGDRVAILRAQGWCGFSEPAPDAGADAAIILQRKAKSIEVQLRGIPNGNMASLVAHHGKERVPLWVRRESEDLRSPLEIPSVPKNSGWKLQLEWMDRRAQLRSVIVAID